MTYSDNYGMGFSLWKPFPDYSSLILTTLHLGHQGGSSHPQYTNDNETQTGDLTCPSDTDSKGKGEQ